MHHSPPVPAGRRFAALAGWLALCLAAAGTGYFVTMDGWYAGLTKPSWQPPPWIFAPVWTALYVMMAVAAWLVWQEGGWRRQRAPLTLFCIQWLLNALWTPLFFGLRRPDLALADILLLWLVIAATIVSFRRVRATAAVLLVPYLAWITFAALLNASIRSLNP